MGTLKSHHGNDNGLAASEASVAMQRPGVIQTVGVPLGAALLGSVATYGIMKVMEDDEKPKDSTAKPPVNTVAMGSARIPMEIKGTPQEMKDLAAEMVKQAMEAEAKAANAPKAQPSTAQDNAPGRSGASSPAPEEKVEAAEDTGKKKKGK